MLASVRGLDLFARTRLLATATYLLPLTGALLIVAVVALGFQIKPNGYGPFLLGIVSAATILSGKFMIGSNLVTYSGIVLLVFASGWSLIPRRSTLSPA